MKRVTVKDIAKAIGVSPAVVSYVLNGKEYKVSQETVLKVKAAIKELNYIPNLTARSLVKNKSQLVGVIIPQTEETSQLLLTNPFYSEIIGGIESKLRQCGYHLLLSGVDKGKSYLDTSVQRNLDGAIIMGIYQEQFYEELKQAQIPIVLIDSYISDNYFYRVGIDDEYGGYLATKYLIEHGHRDIALVTGSIKRDGVNEKRFLGYKRALSEAGIFYNPDYVFDGLVSFEYGYKAGIAIAQNHKKVTGVFASADLMALGVIKGLTESRLKIPEDISVIGFDNISILQFTLPLTTVDQNITAKGIKAAELLIDLIEGKGDNESKEKILPLRIIERETVKRIKDK
ncbi:MAG TPA: LacI family transcriptional regulator [Clostridiaceae bacterium]|nr:LacI family transcriptional regulator [Clostridiaceae bacterium]HHV99095.1 LacI family transcriptional regulator [Clostridiaceae bacterium]